MYCITVCSKFVSIILMVCLFSAGIYISLTSEATTGFKMGIQSSTQRQTPASLQHMIFDMLVCGLQDGGDPLILSVGLNISASELQNLENNVEYRINTKQRVSPKSGE